MSSSICLKPTATLSVSANLRQRMISRFGKRHWQVVLLFLVVFCGLEIVTRNWLFQASKDFSRFQTFPARAEALAQQSGTRIALVGNSLTAEGVDPQALGTAMTKLGAGPIAADVFVADASKINVWHYLVNSYFLRSGRVPDVFIVPYYEDNLIDHNPLEIGRFAQFFVERSDWPEVFAHEVTTFSERSEFLLSSVWATFAARDRIKERVLSVAVPHYQDLTVQLNETLKIHHPETVEPQLRQPVSHELLKRFLARAKQHHVQIIFVAFPTIVPGKQRPYQPYELHSETLQIIREAGMEFVDTRQVPELTPDMYVDDIHLNERGRAIYSQRLAEVLVPIVQRIVLLRPRSSALSGG